MKYRVIFQIGYLDAWFEFDTIEEAGEFAKQILIHQVPSKDTAGRKTHVTIEVVDEEAEKEEKEDE